MLLLDDEMYKTDFCLTQTTDLACARVVEKFMPFAVARPFVKEFITEQIVDRVIKYIAIGNSVFYVLGYSCIAS